MCACNFSPEFTLVTKWKLINDDGTQIGDTVAPIDLPHFSMWKSVELKINEEVVQQDNLSFMRSYVMSRLSYGERSMATWRKDLMGQSIDTPAAGNVAGPQNKGWSTRQDMIAKGRTVVTRGELPFDVFSNGKCWPPGTR